MEFWRLGTLRVTVARPTFHATPSIQVLVLEYMAAYENPGRTERVLEATPGTFRSYNGRLTSSFHATITGATNGNYHSKHTRHCR